MAVSARPRRHAFGTGDIARGQVRSRFTAWLPRQLPTRWLRLARARALPAKLRAQLAFASGERTLMVGRDPDGGCALVATDRALHYRTGSDGWSRLGWEQISRASWEASPGRLVITGLAGAAPPRTVVPMRQRGTWPELAQERITHTKLNRQHVLLDGGQRVVVEVRRCPGTGELRWALVSGRHLNPGDQDLRNQIDRAVTRLCADLGLSMASDAGQLLKGPRP